MLVEAERSIHVMWVVAECASVYPCYVGGGWVTVVAL